MASQHENVCFRESAGFEIAASTPPLMNKAAGWLYLLPVKHALPGDLPRY
jgi:hypothetical protein